MNIVMILKRFADVISHVDIMTDDCDEQLRWILFCQVSENTPAPLLPTEPPRGADLKAVWPN